MEIFIMFINLNKFNFKQLIPLPVFITFSMCNFLELKTMELELNKTTRNQNKDKQSCGGETIHASIFKNVGIEQFLNPFHTNCFCDDEQKTNMIQKYTHKLALNYRKAVKQLLKAVKQLLDVIDVIPKLFSDTHGFQAVTSKNEKIHSPALMGYSGQLNDVINKYIEHLKLVKNLQTQVFHIIQKISSISKIQNNEENNYLKFRFEYSLTKILKEFIKKIIPIAKIDNLSEILEESIKNIISTTEINNQNNTIEYIQIIKYINELIVDQVNEFINKEYCLKVLEYNNFHLTSKNLLTSKILSLSDNYNNKWLNTMQCHEEPIHEEEKIPNSKNLEKNDEKFESSEKMEVEEKETSNDENDESEFSEYYESFDEEENEESEDFSEKKKKSILANKQKKHTSVPIQSTLPKVKKIEKILQNDNTKIECYQCGKLINPDFLSIIKHLNQKHPDIKENKEVGVCWNAKCKKIYGSCYKRHKQEKYNTGHNYLTYATLKNIIDHCNYNKDSEKPLSKIMEEKLSQQKTKKKKPKKTRV
jgi:hypothetical protein